jgi:hypothetical protein
MNQSFNINKNINLAGVPSGYVQRFEMEKNNPKIMKGRNLINTSLERPYTTQNGLRAHRVTQERQSAKIKMEEYEELHPRYIDQKHVEIKPKPKRQRPQTVKERRSQNHKYYRVINGLAKNNDEINKVKNQLNLTYECKKVR